MRKLIENQGKMLDKMTGSAGGQNMRIEECLSTILAEPMETVEQLEEFNEKLEEPLFQNNVVRTYYIHLPEDI